MQIVIILNIDHHLSQRVIQRQRLLLITFRQPECLDIAGRPLNFVDLAPKNMQLLCRQRTLIRRVRPNRIDLPSWMVDLFKQLLQTVLVPFLWLDLFSTSTGHVCIKVLLIHIWICLHRDILVCSQTIIFIRKRPLTLLLIRVTYLVLIRIIRTPIMTILSKLILEIQLVLIPSHGPRRRRRWLIARFECHLTLRELGITARIMIHGLDVTFAHVFM